MATDTKRLDELFQWPTGAEVLTNLRNFTRAVEARLTPLDAQSQNYETTVQQLRQVAIDRLNEVLQPAYLELEELLATGIPATKILDSGLFGRSILQQATRDSLLTLLSLKITEIELTGGVFVNPVFQGATAAHPAVEAVGGEVLTAKWLRDLLRTLNYAPQDTMADFGAGARALAPGVADRSDRVPNTTWVGTVVANAIASLVDSSPAALDTLKELAAALGNDANFATTMSQALGNRLRIDLATQNLSAAQKTNAQTNLGVSAFIRGLLDDLDSSTALTTLGVSTFMKSVLDDADGATARTTLGLGAANDVTHANITVTTAAYLASALLSGALTAGRGSSYNEGGVGLLGGGGANTGFINWVKPNGDRAGYFGYAPAAGGKITLFSEAGFGFNFEGETLPTIGGVNIATVNNITAAIANLVNSSPAALDTLQELAAALGNDPNFATTINNALGNRLRIDAAQGLSLPNQNVGLSNLGVQGWARTVLQQADSNAGREQMGLGTGQNVQFRDITASRGDGTGVIFLGAGRYVYWNGSSYEMPGGNLILNGKTVAKFDDTPRFGGVLYGSGLGYIYSDSGTNNIVIRSGPANSFKYSQQNEVGHFEFAATGRFNGILYVTADRIVVGEGRNASYVEMRDTDEGTRYVHNNGSTIGFLGSNGAWVLRSFDDGNIWTPYYGYLANFFAQSSDLAGTNSANGNGPYVVQRFPSGAVYQAGTTVLQLDGNGKGRIPLFLNSAANSVCMPVATNGGYEVNGNWVTTGESNTTSFGVYMPNSAGATVRINWFAWSRWK